MLNLGAVLVGTNHWGGESQPEKWVIRTVVETASVGRYDSAFFYCAQVDK